MTIREVAARAGVSAATVSRAFSQPQTVTAETRQRVMSAASELGYTPNPVARSLAKGETGNLGLMVPDISNSFFAVIVKSALRQARSEGYSLFIVDADLEPDDEYRQARAIAARVDGLMLASPNVSDHRIRELAGLVPVVMTNRVLSGVPSVLMDTSAATVHAVEHLHALGHRDITYLVGPDNYANRNRLQAFRTACEQLRLPGTELGPFQPTFAAGVRAADLVLAAGTTAVIAYNDVVAAGVVGRLTERGATVPGDISVAGFDDTGLAEMVIPRLTTVRLPAPTAGSVAVKLLLDVLRGADLNERDPVELTAELIVRASTGAAPAARDGAGRDGSHRDALEAPALAP